MRLKVQTASRLIQVFYRNLTPNQKYIRVTKKAPDKASKNWCISVPEGCLIKPVKLGLDIYVCSMSDFHSTVD
jgi:hypothetical protein